MNNNYSLHINATETLTFNHEKQEMKRVLK